MREPLSPTELDLIEQYAAGVLTEAQRVQVHALLARRPELGDRIARIKRQLVGHVPAPVPVDVSWQQFRTRVGMDARGVPQSATHTTPSRVNPSSHRPISALHPRSPSRSMMAWGAALAAAVIAAVVLCPRAERPGHAVLRQYVTTMGQRATVTLPDGARATLAPQTTLRVLSGYGRTTRDVWLEGEAYFEVSHTQAAPFVVQTGAVHTHVLGTTFDVRHYASDRSVQVAVVTGKVAVSDIVSRQAPVTLSAGRVGIVSDSNTTTVTASDMAPYTGWVNGRLTFERTPVPEVLAAVGRWYGYEFHLADSVLATRHLSASFEQQSPADVLAALQTALNVTMTFDGHVVTLHPRHDSAAPSGTRRQSTEFPQSREVGR